MIKSVQPLKIQYIPMCMLIREILLKKTRILVTLCSAGKWCLMRMLKVTF